mgnify:CR=1 FL=1
MAKRIFLIVLDSFGIGAEPDAPAFGDAGTNTLGAIAGHPNFKWDQLARLGMFNLDGVTCGTKLDAPVGCYARLREASAGKDTTIGHWEIAGLLSPEPLPTFPNGFPKEVLDEFTARTGYQVLCNKPYSGTEVIKDYGEEHMKTGALIVYTSADSVFQIACSEAIFSREELYEMCRIAREMLTGDLCVGRVIARPFVGEKAGAFQRTSGRRDFSVEPFSRTLLDAVKDAGMESYGVGKIEDIFALRGLTGSNHAAGNPACIEAWLDYMRKPFNGLCFTNLVDTDMLYGHRRDPQGFADALAYFDSKLPEIIDLLGDEDLLVITADHGCDPTFKGTDHTREHIPLLVYHKGMKGLTDLGVRKTYADIGATCAEWLGLPDRFGATSFMDKLK